MNNCFARFQMWLQRVMAGRYGGDQLNWLLLILYLILWAAGMFSAVFVLFPILCLAAVLSHSVPHVFPQPGEALGRKPEIPEYLESYKRFFHKQNGSAQG